MRYQSVLYISSNENKEIEITFELPQTFIDSLLNKPSKKLSFNFSVEKQTWVVKSTKVQANRTWRKRCSQAFSVFSKLKDGEDFNSTVKEITLI